MLEALQQPWPWYITGPLIGLMVPLLLLAGNKPFGLSSSLKHICAMCSPAKIDFFNYDWKKEMWNVVLVLGIGVGGLISNRLLSPSVQISDATVQQLSALGISINEGEINPSEIFNWQSLFHIKGILLLILGGFLVGFGSRYADGCTSGHAIMGLSMFNPASLMAVISFFAGGLFMTHLVLPFILKL
ncbi:MAG: YeeE/YedE family protein [Cytophagaceae bacterium]|nr:YeeE/YedE family protein [Cytophagaceae bacterium]MDW8455214.1 YeeE/YedE thiosulfate transporter family protein [Cytophagaceae bacterium]